MFKAVRGLSMGRLSIFRWQEHLIYNTARAGWRAGAKKHWQCALIDSIIPV